MYADMILGEFFAVFCSYIQADDLVRQVLQVLVLLQFRPLRLKDLLVPAKNTATTKPRGFSDVERAIYRIV